MLEVSTETGTGRGARELHGGTAEFTDHHEARQQVRGKGELEGREGREERPAVGETTRRRRRREP